MTASISPLKLRLQRILIFAHFSNFRNLVFSFSEKQNEENNLVLKRELYIITKKNRKVFIIKRKLQVQFPNLLGFINFYKNRKIYFKKHIKKNQNVFNLHQLPVLVDEKCVLFLNCGSWPYKIFLRAAYSPWAALWTSWQAELEHKKPS